MSEIWLIRSTFAKKDEALSIAHTLLEEKLVACANISDSVTALFRWEGMIQQEQEVAMFAKTTKSNVSRAIHRIKALHSYQIPSIVAWPVGAVSEDFADWVAEEVA